MYFVCTENLVSVQTGCVSFASPYMKDLSGVASNFSQERHSNTSSFCGFESTASQLIKSVGRWSGHLAPPDIHWTCKKDNVWVQTGNNQPGTGSAQIYRLPMGHNTELVLPRGHCVPPLTQCKGTFGGSVCWLWAMVFLCCGSWWTVHPPHPLLCLGMKVAELWENSLQWREIELRICSCPYLLAIIQFTESPPSASRPAHPSGKPSLKQGVSYKPLMGFRLQNGRG